MSESNLTTGIPSDKEIDAQMDRLETKLQSPRQFEALSVLMKVWRSERNPSDNAPRVSNAQLYADIYKRELMSGAKPVEAYTKSDENHLVSERIRKSLNDLSRNLHRYYTTEPGILDRVTIQISDGKSGYRPIVRYREFASYALHNEGAPYGLVPEAPVSLDDPSGVTIYPNWDKFLELLNTVERDEADTDDIRIVTMAFKRHEVPADKFVELASRNLRIKVMLTDPDSCEWLVRMRNRIRHRHDRETEEYALRSIKDQIVQLRDCAAQVEDRRMHAGCTGGLDLHLSDLMPYGFAALTSGFVILGLFLAQGSYGAGPMIVVDSVANPSLADALRKDWDERLAHALGRHTGVGAQLRNPGSGVISDAHFINELEAKVPDGTTDIWIAAPDLANVGDSRSAFSELVRKTVRHNAGRGIGYTYICPKGHAGTARIEKLRECFAGMPGKLRLYEVPPERFNEITLVATHFVVLNPQAEPPQAYMQLPLGRSQKGWIELEPPDSRNVVAKMREIIDDFQAREASA